jgi:Pyruvate/2-oxoacid:ferredoxin oxidoreductase delta subunit
MRKVTRKIIELDEERCDGCGQCVPACAEGAIQIIDGKARLVADKFCDGLGACLGECPNDALHVIEREAEEFDEEAVEEYLGSLGRHEEAAAEPAMACGCPSTQVRSFEAERGCPGAALSVGSGAGESALTHWPIQIRLIPPTAPFLKGADLLVLADCVGGAYAGLHRDLMKGRVVMMGCPKLDDAEAYIEKFAEVFRTARPRSVTIAMMEVPCCSGLAQIVRQAQKAAGSGIPVEEVVFSIRGEPLRKMKASA